MPEGMTAAGAHTRAEAEAAFTELMEHIKEIETAAREWGIRPDHLEGRFVSAMAAAQAGLGRIAVAASKDALAVAGLVRAAADSEAERMRSSVAMVDTQLRRIDAEVRRAEIHRKDLETKTVASLTKAVAEKLKDVLVIRERRWNRRDRHISWGAAAAAALVILLGGYTWRGVQDRFTYATAAEAWARCQDTAFMDKASGRPFCQIELTSLPPPSQRLLSR